MILHVWLMRTLRRLCLASLPRSVAPGDDRVRPADLPRAGFRVACALPAATRTVEARLAVPEEEMLQIVETIEAYTIT